MRYQFLKQRQRPYSLQALCRVLPGSRSGSTDWQKRLPPRRATEEQERLTTIRQEFHTSKGAYGSPRLRKELREKGIRCSRNRLVRIRRKHEITARPLRRFTVTTDSGPSLPVAPNPTPTPEP